MESTTRAQAVSLDSSPVIQMNSECWRAQMLFLEQLAGMQASWLSSWLALQAGWARGQQGLPMWMVWHNGMEQLA